MADAVNELERLITEQRVKADRLYDEVLCLPREHLWYVGRDLARTDLYFLLTRVMERKDAQRNWPFARSREVQAEPDERLDLWARDHYKSTIISVAKSIQDTLVNPEITIGIFSFKQAAAQDIVDQIKREYEQRMMLRWLFSDIIWENPRREAPSWSVQNGITLKRETNPRECTFEGHTFMEGAPVGKHFMVCLYDDVVTRDSVQTPENIIKTTERWELSLALGRADCRRRYVGTRYHFQDTYQEMIKRKAAIPRVYPAEDENGRSVFLTTKQLEKKKRDMGPTTYAAQMMLNPTMDSVSGFKDEWRRHYREMPARRLMNVYIICDPANEKKKTSDWTVFFVIGLAGDFNYYVLDIVRDRLSLRERCTTLIRLWRKWSPNHMQIVNGVFYEKYGMQADIEAIEMAQDKEACLFDVTEVGGTMKKRDRINRLEPTFAARRILFPEMLFYTQYDGLMVDLVHHFFEQEYKPFPAVSHDDMLDCLARIEDPDVDMIFPAPQEVDTVGQSRGSSWSN